MVKKEKDVCHQCHDKPNSATILILLSLKDLHRDFLNMAKIWCFRNSLKTELESEFVFSIYLSWCLPQSQQASSSLNCGFLLLLNYREQHYLEVPVWTPHTQSHSPFLQLRHSRKSTLCHIAMGFHLQSAAHYCPYPLRLPNAFHKNTAADNQVWPLACTDWVLGSIRCAPVVGSLLRRLV